MRFLRPNSAIPLFTMAGPLLRLDEVAQGVGGGGDLKPVGEVTSRIDMFVNITILSSMVLERIGIGEAIENRSGTRGHSLGHSR